MISDEILKSINNIPAFPAAALKVMKLIDDPDFSITDVVDVHVHFGQGYSSLINLLSKQEQLLSILKPTLLFDVFEG